MNDDIVKTASKLAKDIRIAELEMFSHLGFGHIGGALSITDVFAVLYAGAMKFDPENPKWDDRDRLVVSKGHAGPALYATLATVGFFDKEVLKTLNQGGTNLPSHCDRTKTIGIDMTTGSLGQGISTACGIAYALKQKGNKVYCIVGDGESQEGQIWEGIMFAAQKKLDNLVLFIDYNKKQLDGYIDDICTLGNLQERVESFGWNVLEIDGHNHAEIASAIDKVKTFNNEKPVAIICNTVKGKGAKFVEDAMANHHMVVSKEDAQGAIEALRG